MPASIIAGLLVDRDVRYKNAEKGPRGCVKRRFASGLVVLVVQIRRRCRLHDENVSGPVPARAGRPSRDLAIIAVVVVVSLPVTLARCRAGVAITRRALYLDLTGSRDEGTQHRERGLDPLL